ncbi:helix-turn-helix transcriptional regulator [Vallitalea sediminicola]
MKNFNDIIKYLRASNNMTQQDLANHLGVSRATIAGYETKGKQPDYEKLITLSKLFNVSVDYLIGSDTNEKSKEITNSTENLSMKIHNLLIEKGIITKDEELTEEKIEWLQKLIGHAIDLSKL